MALVVGSSGGRGGVRLIFSGLLQRLLGLRSRRVRSSTRSGSHTGDEDDDTAPLVDSIARDIFSGSTSPSLYGSDSSSARVFGAMHPPSDHPDWPARKLFDVGTARPQSAKRGLEMTASTRHATRFPREHVMPPAVVMNTAPGQPPMLQIPVTDGLLAAFLAQVSASTLVIVLDS
ncbi:hypothetical protein ACUV84_003256 [Puccinellia chinampoensis]